MTLDKHFDPKLYEQRIYEQSETYFSCKLSSDKPPYVIMMPPPNVTGSLHLGHALNDTLQDILIRYHRKRGYDVLWQPGTDHAGIATQIVVERQLAAQGLSRHDLGREKFIEKVWEWKEQSGNTILNQKRRLCISADWQRSRFTMDEGLSRAVTKIFVELHKEGLIYRDKRLVNWDTKLQTAISDLEVESREQDGHMWYIAYAIDGSDEVITVATTRPETLFGDTAIAVHMEDERYQHLVGRFAKLPITGRLIPIVADEYCDQTKGTGAVKITPGHDMNDFEVGKRHNLEMMNIIDATGHFIAPAPADYVGLNAAAARKKILEALEANGELIKTEKIRHTVPYSERSNVEIQPWLTDQWFLDAKILAEPALKAVEEGKTQFFPEMWQNTYFEWLRNIQPWCISRQIWWGHQIPAWHSQDGHIFVAQTQEEALAQAKQVCGDDVILNRDTDVLDTWFSSALWPFTTLGWPDNTPELKRYYPTSVLTTGFDIIFFWVARMMMMGIHFMKEVPFKTVYIHALIRDEKGQKMSKSKGNIIDPLELIDAYGADAVRFTMAKYASPGRDVKIGKSLVEHGRNFITKMWNAAKFLKMNDLSYDASFNPLDPNAPLQHPLNAWIVSQTVKMCHEASQHIEAFRFDLMSHTLYQYFWGDFCDVYVESLKILLSDPIAKEETSKTAMWCFISFLNTINPVMPIVSQAIFEAFADEGFEKLITSLLPVAKDAIAYRQEQEEIDWVIQFVTELRSIKGLLGLQAGAKVSLALPAKEKMAMRISQHWLWVRQLAKLDQLSPNGAGITVTVNGLNVALILQDDISISSIHNLLAEKKAVLDNEVKHLEKKLANDAFKQAKPDLWAADQALMHQKTNEIGLISTILASVT